ncbi:MAG: hypothetical protein J7527_05655 [Chitinophagaceae bacterium]|nr:hypothetical protein [Chitinophagaceae bacterium]
MLGLIIYFGIKALEIEFSVLEIGLIENINDLPFLILALATTSVIFIDARYFSRSRKWYQLLSSVIGIALVAIVLKGKLERYSTNTSPSVMLMHHIPGKYPVYKLQLKKNGKFMLHDLQIFGGEIYYGRYEWKDDSIHLFGYAHEGGEVLPRAGLVRGDTVSWNDSIVLTIAREEDGY